MFKTAVITDEISQDIKTAAELAKKYDLDAVEIRSVNGRGAFELTKEDVAEIKAVTADMGLGVCCIDSPFFKCELDSAREVQENLDGLKRCIHMARELGASLIRGFTFWDGGDFTGRLPDIIARFPAPARLLEDAGITLVLEPDPGVYTTNAAKLAGVIKAVSLPQVQALWDPGNDIFDPDGEIPYPGGYEAIKPWIRHVHLKDARRMDGKPGAVPIGTGDALLEPQLRRLIDDGYTGYVSLETHYRHRSTLSEELLAMPKGNAFSYGGYEATEESLILWRKMLERITGKGIPPLLNEQMEGWHL